MTREEILERLISAAPVVVAAVIGRLFYRAFGVGEPPAGEAEVRLWLRRFRFMIASELFSIPVLIAGAIYIPGWLSWSADQGAVFGLILGIVGYGTAAAAGRAMFDVWTKGIAKGVARGE